MLWRCVRVLSRPLFSPLTPGTSPSWLLPSLAHACSPVTRTIRGRPQGSTESRRMGRRLPPIGPTGTIHRRDSGARAHVPVRGVGVACVRVGHRALGHGQARLYVAPTRCSTRPGCCCPASTRCVRATCSRTCRRCSARCGSLRTSPSWSRPRPTPSTNGDRPRQRPHEGAIGRRHPRPGGAVGHRAGTSELPETPTGGQELHELLIEARLGSTESG